MSDNQEKDLFEQSIDSVQIFTDKGYIKEAFQMVEALEKAYPNRKQELLWQKVLIYDKCVDNKNALLILIELYEQFQDNNAYEIIEENFFIPKKAEMTNMYKKNKDIVEKYDYFFGNIPEEPDCIIIYSDDDLVVTLNGEKKSFAGFIKTKMDVAKTGDSSIFLEGPIFESQIEEIAQKCKSERFKIGCENAIYLAFSKWEFEAYLQAIDIGKQINDRKYVYLVGKEGINQCFEDSGFNIPEKGYCLNGRALSLRDCFNEIVKKQSDKMRFLIKELGDIYRKNIEELTIRVNEHNPKILFMTSRFTTVLQYHAKNTMEAAKKHGCECELLIESDNIKRTSKLKLLEILMEFKPDVIFTLDHFRYEYGDCVPEEIIWITWIQDPMDHIINPDTYKKLGKKDMVINHLISWDWLKQLYHGKLIDAPVPSNQDIYKIYDLTDEEMELYGADICFVCHASDVESWIDEFLNDGVPDADSKSIIRQIFNQYYEDGKEGRFLYNKKDFSEYIEKELQRENYTISEHDLEFLAENMYMWLNQRIFRQVLADWIIDAGFENIKLWGKGWKESPKYKRYAMGEAQNGETLSKIYQASKIVIGNNIMTTAASRTWESMLSGAFYLSNYIPKGDDLVDINLIMPEGTVVFFKNKQELIEKIHYYLEHEEERKNMAEIGRREALKRMTFDALIEKALNRLPEYI
ncbi:glycosyltransferase family protein [Butyrivibrio sp. NC2002]|uniref:glycosyltransferase family protein n=1 Tax=Butyrivibrio sp. NC2002 TaxID=1410610 RepID=UPI000565D5EC|nr:glycosyltransferase [Butyrivibrio sp. NC2002]